MFPRKIMTLLTVLTVASSQIIASDLYSLFDQTSKDFGEIEKGTVAKHSFVLSNNSRYTLKIRNIDVSCSCTQAYATSTVINPGESITIESKMDSSRFIGDKSVSIYVYFSKPRRTKVILNVKAKAVGDLNGEISEVDFGNIDEGTTQTKKLNLEYSKNPNWEIQEISFANQNIKTELSDKKIIGNKVKYELTIILDGAAAGKLETPIKIKTNDNNTGTITIIAKATIQSNLTIFPNEFRLDSIEPGTKVEKKFVLKSKEPFTITKVLNTDGMFNVKSSPTERNAQVVIIEFTAPEDASSITDHLEIITSLSSVPTLEVPVVR